MAHYIQKEGVVVNALTNSRASSAYASAVWSDGIDIERFDTFGVWLCAAPASAASANGITVWYELAPANAASLYTCAGLISVGASALSSNAGSAKTITPVAMPWMRVGLSALGSGGATVANSCSATIKLYAR